MKLICTQENLKKAILNTERVVSKQNTLPILNNILFETEKGILKLSATNLEIGVVAKLSAKIEKEGKIAIPVKTLSNFINNLLPGDNIFLETEENNLKIKSGHSKAVIKGYSAEDFPLIPQKSSDFLVSVSLDTMKNISTKVLSCVAFNEARQELSGVNVILGNQELFFAATDSFRLAEIKVVLETEDFLNKENYHILREKKDNLIIPSATLIELSRAVSGENSGKISIAIEEGQIFFETDGVTLVSRLINGKYPEYKHILPKSYATQVFLDKKVLQSAVKMANVFANAKSSEINLKIDASENKLLIEGKSVEVGENSSEVEIEVAGDNQEIVFNAKYLLDGINNIDTPQIALLANNASSPVALKACDDAHKIQEGYIYIVMPVKN